jgi:hypothetical protein
MLSKQNKSPVYQNKNRYKTSQRSIKHPNKNNPNVVNESVMITLDNIYGTDIYKLIYT